MLNIIKRYKFASIKYMKLSLQTYVFDLIVAEIHIVKVKSEDIKIKTNISNLINKQAR